MNLRKIAKRISKENYQIFFKENDDKFMELIISKCAKEIGIEKIPTIGEKTTIVNLVATRNRNNQFYTHCFPGALYGTVKQNGLDISNEMFKEELGLLEKYFKTGFKTGKSYLKPTS